MKGVHNNMHDSTNRLGGAIIAVLSLTLPKPRTCLTIEAIHATISLIAACTLECKQICQ